MQILVFAALFQSEEVSQVLILHFCYFSLISLHVSAQVTAAVVVLGSSGDSTLVLVTALAGLQLIVAGATTAGLLVVESQLAAVVVS